MSRPLRLEYAGAFYHVTARGDHQGAIFLDERDRLAWLDVLGDVCARCNFVIHAYCLMGNHYHLLVETVDGKLSQGMRQLNGEYSRYFNRRHGVTGHVFQGRYHSIICNRDEYLLELSRYIDLNPVRAGLVADPAAWRWSSHLSVLGKCPRPAWLETGGVLSYFGSDIERARRQYRIFVRRGLQTLGPLREIRHRLLLGKHEMVVTPAPMPGDTVEEIVRVHRRVLAWPLPAYFAAYTDPREAMAQAYLSTAYTMPEIARHAGVCTRTVSRAVRRFEQVRAK